MIAVCFAIQAPLLNAERAAVFRTGVQWLRSTLQSVNKSIDVALQSVRMLSHQRTQDLQVHAAAFAPSVSPN